MSRGADITRGSRPVRQWILLAVAIAVVGLAIAAVKWISSGSSSAGPSLLTPAALPAARAERPALMIAGRAGDVLVGLRVRPGGPIDITVIPADTKPIPKDALAITVGRQRVAATRCGASCFRVAASHALRRRLALRVTVDRDGKQPARAAFVVPPRLPPAADGLLRALSRSMSRIRSFRVDETLSSGLSGIKARFLFRAPDRMSYVTSDGARAVVIGAKRWDSDKRGPWKQTEATGVRVPSFMWSGAGGARLVGRSSLEGSPVRVLAAFRPDADFPAWFRLFVRPDRRVVRAEMIAPAHFMVDRLSSFDQRVRISPPTPKPSVWAQMRPIGTGPRYQPKPISARVERALPVGELRCRTGAGARFGAHLEIFANERVVIIPAGVGIAPPHRREGAYVRGGRCSYPARTIEPTGVIQLDRTLTLGRFFELWGEPLTGERLAGFTARSGGRVLAFVAGRPWRGDLRAIPLGRHSQIVLEVNGYVPPHTRYVFPPGL